VRIGAVKSAFINAVLLPVMQCGALMVVPEDIFVFHGCDLGLSNAFAYCGWKTRQAGLVLAMHIDTLSLWLVMPLQEWHHATDELSPRRSSTVSMAHRP